MPIDLLNPPKDLLEQPMQEQQPAQEPLQNAPVVQNAPSNQITPPIDLRGAIKDRLSQRENGKWTQAEYKEATDPMINAGTSAVGGLNSIAPALAGLPKDTIQNIINLGIAAYGGGKALMGADPSTLPEQPPRGGIVDFQA